VSFERREAQATTTRFLQCEHPCAKNIRLKRIKLERGFDASRSSRGFRRLRICCKERLATLSSLSAKAVGIRSGLLTTAHVMKRLYDFW
jgi:hypothetical protein